METVIKQSRFTERMVKLNGLRFNKWIFEPGMLFSAGMKWWEEIGRRGQRHNGLDLRSYEADDGTVKALDPGTKVPIIYEGKIVSSIKDFLGHTLFAAHEIYQEDSQLFTIYGHVLQTPDLPFDRLLNEGTEIAVLAGSSNRNVPAHLHISAALIPMAIPAEALTWK
ncbi:MAG TPA: hypothetical protein VN328_04400, partial [Thermodesulfovibrionales bacterium]|nr:hypothetical protein [Thermodesulfovibrionales bacterium]